MGSRRARKRERYRAAIGQDERDDRQKMQPKPPVFKEITGGIGGRHARGDLVLIHRAICQDWPLTDEKRVAVTRHIRRVAPLMARPVPLPVPPRMVLVAPLPSRVTDLLMTT
jgi:hypothetical protein